MTGGTKRSATTIRAPSLRSFVDGYFLVPIELTLVTEASTFHAVLRGTP